MGSGTLNEGGFTLDENGWDEATGGVTARCADPIHDLADALAGAAQPNTDGSHQGEAQAGLPPNSAQQTGGAALRPAHAAISTEIGDPVGPAATPKTGRQDSGLAGAARTGVVGESSVPFAAAPGAVETPNLDRLLSSGAIGASFALTQPAARAELAALKASARSAPVDDDDEGERDEAIHQCAAIAAAEMKRASEAGFVPYSREEGYHAAAYEIYMAICRLLVLRKRAAYAETGEPATEAATEIVEWIDRKTRELRPDYTPIRPTRVDLATMIRKHVPAPPSAERILTQATDERPTVSDNASDIGHIALDAYAEWCDKHTSTPLTVWEFVGRVIQQRAVRSSGGAAVVMPDEKPSDTEKLLVLQWYREGWNACLAEFRRLNPLAGYVFGIDPAAPGGDQSVNSGAASEAKP